MKRTIVMTVIALTLGGISCDQLSDRRKTHSAKLALDGGVAGLPSAQPTVAPGGDATTPDRKLVTTARMTVEVTSVADATRNLQERAVDASGFVGSSESSRDENGRANATLTLRVPAGRVDATLAFVRQLGRVSAEEFNSDDVTKAYFDLETRLRVKRQTEERMRALLQNHAGKLSEVVDVERELDRLVGQIEELEGARAYYDHQIAMAVITVFLAEPGQAVRWTALTPIREAFHNSIKALAASVAALIYVVCFVAPWLLVATIGWSAWRRGARWWLRWTKAE